MKLLQIGRLSVMPVEEAEYKLIVEMGHVEPKPLPVQVKVRKPKKAAKVARKKSAKKPVKKLLKKRKR